MTLHPMDLIRSTNDVAYRMFGRYFFEKEVGVFWSITNCFIASFWIGVGLIYLFKPWGLINFHKNVIKNKRRLRKQAFERLAEELESEDDSVMEKRRKIVDLRFNELRESLGSGELSAVDAVDAYRWKAMEVQQKYNCVTEFVREAMDWAKALDQEYSGKKKPPLFGIPFSVKDNFFMEGYDASRGLGKECEFPKQADCSFVAQLRSLGAIPIVRTNVPQMLLAYMCSNPVYGTTKNPHNIERSPGGSSGGEATLVSAGGTVFGIGSDLAGSMRIPAQFCGVCTMKPTSNRCKTKNAHPCLPGCSRLGLGYGFFTRDAETQSFLWEQFLNEEYFRRVPTTVPLPFIPQNGAGERFPLKIGYFTDDGWFSAVPSCVRAVEESKSVLEELGHQMIPFDVPRPYDGFGIMVKCFMPDNGKFVLDSLRYDQVEELFKPMKRLIAAPIPLCVRGVLANMMKPVWPRVANLLGSYVKSQSDLRMTYEAADEYVKEFTEKWQAAGLDAIICPGFPVAAVPHDVPARLTAVAFSTGLWNVLDFPVGIVPVTKVNEEDEKKLMTEYPTPEMASSGSFNLRYPFYGLARDASRNSLGLPVGVQIATLPYQEELCVQIMQILDENNKK